MENDNYTNSMSAMLALDNLFLMALSGNFAGAREALRELEASSATIEAVGLGPEARMASEISFVRSRVRTIAKSLMDLGRFEPSAKYVAGPVAEFVRECEKGLGLGVTALIPVMLHMLDVCEAALYRDYDDVPLQLRERLGPVFSDPAKLLLLRRQLLETAGGPFTEPS